MKKILLSLKLLLFTCIKNINNIVHKNISVEQAKKMMDTQEVLIIDVRTAPEYEEGHIKNAINIPLDELEKYNGDKEKPILLYCRSGNRSKIAATTLAKKGYKNVYNFGGINDWKYEIEK